MWRSRLACTRSLITRDRSHSRRTQAGSADHRRLCEWRCRSASGAALVESELVIIPIFSLSVVIAIR
jgi:hypothetical protein